MKRITSVLIAILLIFAAITLTACGNSATRFDDATYMVTFDSQGGSAIESKTVYSGNIVINPGNPTREGYYFIGWYKSTEENAEEWKFATDAVTSNITLYARWKEKNSSVSDNADETPSETKILVVYFSRADENYSVGIIEKGNTEIIAEIIKENVGGTLFHIERATAYPATYKDCTDEAKAEQNAKARPAIKADVNIEDYDIIFLGYPIWWGDLPMPTYSFIENHDWSGKVVYPFVTHEGSGLSGTVSTLKSKLVGAAVKDGLAVRGATAQNSKDSARQAVVSWLDDFNLGSEK